MYHTKIQPLKTGLEKIIRMFFKGEQINKFTYDIVYFLYISSGRYLFELNVRERLLNPNVKLL